MKVGYSSDFANPAKCRRVALRQLAEGSGVVLNVAGTCGLGALRAAKDEGAWGVGVDVDQAYLGPHMLTSALMKLDKGTFAVVQRFVRGKLAAAPEHRLRPAQRRRRARADQPQGRALASPPGRGDPEGDHRRQDPGAASYLTRSRWVPTHTAPSPAATEIGCGATHTTRVASSLDGSIRQR